MDEAVNHSTRKQFTRAGAGLLVALASLACVPAGAQALQDPTRPQAGAVPAGASAGLATAAAPQLQSVLVGRAKGGRRIAMIDGETVRPGDSFRGARVARVDETEVELVRGSERQVLRLYPQDAAVAAAAAQPAERR